MAILSRLAISLLPVFMLLMLAVPAQALDAMRLDSRFSVTHLSPLITEREPTPLFAVRNGDDSRLFLLITRARLPVLLRAFMPDAPPPPGLRLFASDDTEFATAPDRPGHLTFFAPPASVMTYQLFGDDAAPGLYLWTPAYFAELEARRDTMRLFLFSLLSVMLLAGLFVGLYRRSRRALYACVMASSMLFLLASLWLENLTGLLGLATMLAENRILLIRGCVTAALMLIGLAHLNLVVRRVVHRNYWTRVVISCDICLGVMVGFIIAALVAPEYAGLLTGDLIDMGLVMTIAAGLIGALFVPERRFDTTPLTI